MLSNAYLLAKFRFDTAENERNFTKILPKTDIYPTDPAPPTSSEVRERRAGPAVQGGEDAWLRGRHAAPPEPQAPPENTRSHDLSTSSIQRKMM